MGKAIEEIALQRGHTIVLKINSLNAHELTTEALQPTDVVIEFTNPENAYDNIATCLQAGKPTLSGSTGWLAKQAEVEAMALEKNTAFLYASNFSVGVNLFFKINQYVAQLMAPYSNYRLGMEEVHHTAKKDAPSGTAITLAEGILEHRQDITQWINAETNDPTVLGIRSVREDPAPGTHTIRYQAEEDEILIQHTAHSRKGFAFGAVLAAEFLWNKKGIFRMADVLGLK